MQRDDLDDRRATNTDLLNENRGTEHLDRGEDVERDPDPAAIDATGVGMTSGGPPSVVVSNDSDDGSITGPRDHDQADDARLERDRAR